MFKFSQTIEPRKRNNLSIKNIGFIIRLTIHKLSSPYQVPALHLCPCAAPELLLPVTYLSMKIVIMKEISYSPQRMLLVPQIVKLYYQRLDRLLVPICLSMMLRMIIVVSFWILLPLNVRQSVGRQIHQF